MTWLDDIRNTGPRESALTALSEYDRTRVATLVSWCCVAKAAELLGVSYSTLERAMQGAPTQDRTREKIVAGLDRAYDALEPACVRLARSLT